MAYIIIIEDDIEQREYIVDCAEKINPELEILTSGSVEESLAMAERYSIEAFFIDIQLTDGSGIMLAKQIREMEGYRFIPIVFITGVPTKEMEAFHQVHCYDYILKPFTDRDIETVMKSLLIDYIQKDEKKSKEVRYLSINKRGIDYRINIEDILYVECRNRKIVIVTKQEEIKYRILSIKAFSKELPEDFIQIHQSISVNKAQIKCVKRTEKEIELYDTDEVIPIGYKFMDNVKAVIR